METEQWDLLLVEDDPDDALLLRDMLEDVPSARFELHHAQELEAALEMLERVQPDVVLLDLSLPDSRGLATFERLHDQAPDVPVVVLTGLPDETVAVAAVQRGAQDYLMKGEVGGPLLVRSLQYAIERQRNSHFQATLLERERLDTAIAHMGDGIVVTDADWRVMTTNRAACLLLNLGEDECVGAPLEATLSAFELSRPVAELRAGTERAEAFEVARPDTQPPLYLDARLTRLFDPRGHLTSTVLSLRDVTDVRREQQLKTSFLMMVSHKLRTPLSVLIACLELCKRLPPERAAEQLVAVLDVCDTEVKRLGEVIEGLLDLKALAAPDAEAAPDSADVRPAITEAARKVLSAYPDRQVELTIDVNEATKRVACGSTHLLLIVEQLIDNAVKFADKDPVEVSVAASPQADGTVVVAVSDNGPGIPHEYHDRVFGGFVQVEDMPTGQVPGLGVGLYMAREVAEAHSATIAVRSELGVGSTFSVTLPALDG